MHFENSEDSHSPFVEISGEARTTICTEKGLHFHWHRRIHLYETQYISVNMIYILLNRWNRGLLGSYIFLSVNNQQGKFLLIAQAFENWIVFFFRGNFIKKYGFRCKKFVSYLQFIFYFHYWFKKYFNILSSTNYSQLLFRNFLITGCMNNFTDIISSIYRILVHLSVIRFQTSPVSQISILLFNLRLFEIKCVAEIHGNLIYLWLFFSQPKVSLMFFQSCFWIPSRFYNILLITVLQFIQ